MHYMKFSHILLSLVITVFTVDSNAQINQTNAAGKKTGVWEKKYPNSNVTRYIGQFDNGQPTGVFKYYEPNGKLSLELNHVKLGVAEATAYSLVDGKKIATGKYVNQKKDGVWKFYDTQGRVVSKEQLTADVKNGWTINYYESGNVVDSTFYTNGIKNGKYVYYFDAGNVKTLCYYNERGELTGTYKEFDAKGNKVYVGEYNEGSKTGKWHFFNPDGSVRYYTIQTGIKVDTTVRMNGEFEDTYPSGKTKVIANYRNGKLHGKYIELFDNGEYVYEEKTDRRSQSTDTYKVLKGQSTKFVGNYTMGLLNGPAKEYNEAGRVIKETQFKMGKVVESGEKGK